MEGKGGHGRGGSRDRGETRGVGPCACCKAGHGREAGLEWTWEDGLEEMRGDGHELELERFQFPKKSRAMHSVFPSCQPSAVDLKPRQL